MPINLASWKSIFQHKLAAQIRNLIRSCKHVWNWVCAPVCHYMCMPVWLWTWTCASVLLPVEVTARSQKRQLHPNGSAQSALSAVLSSCYGSSSEGCIHGQRRKLASPNNRPPVPSPPARLMTCWWTCLEVGGQWLRAAEWQWGMMRERMRKKRVTPHRWGGEMRKWKDETKFDYYQEVGVWEILHFRKWLLFCWVHVKWRWIFERLFLRVCFLLKARVWAEVKGARVWDKKTARNMKGWRGKVR